MKKLILLFLVFSFLFIKNSFGQEFGDVNVLRVIMQAYKEKPYYGNGSCYQYNTQSKEWRLFPDEIGCLGQNLVINLNKGVSFNGEEPKAIQKSTYTVVGKTKIKGEMYFLFYLNLYIEEQKILVAVDVPKKKFE